MGLYEVSQESFSLKEKPIIKTYEGNQIHLTFSFEKGIFTVKAESLTAPNGAKGVRYDCFIVALGQWHQQIIEETEFVEDIKKIVGLITECKEDREVMASLLKEHIDRTGRLIDSDLCTYISELYLTLQAINGNCDQDKFLDKMFQVAEQGFGNHFFITQYQKTPLGVKPFLVPFLEYIKYKL